MIPSYKEELRSRAKKNFVFWVIVLIFAVFLQLFFQGYYINYRGFMHGSDESKKTFLKPFGIIDVHVFPSPDSMRINDEGYNNSTKTIFDLGTYMLSIQKEGYIGLTFPIEITEKNPFYADAINLIRYPEYQSTGLDFNRIEKVDSVFITASGSRALYVVDKDFHIQKMINTQYVYLGGRYFSDGRSLFEYVYTKDTFTPIDTQGIVKTGSGCTGWALYSGVPFCAENMRFLDTNIVPENEKILTIHDGIVLTNRYLYNIGNTNTDWRYYENRNPRISHPDSLVRINAIPYVFQSGSLMTLDALTESGVLLPKIDLDVITQARQFGTESIFIGTKAGKGAFVLLGENKGWSGQFDTDDISDLQVRKINGIYVFYSSKGAYVYYRGSNEISKILADPVIALIDSTLFFRRDGKVYEVDLLRK